jgi:hypothetical protein
MLHRNRRKKVEEVIIPEEIVKLPKAVKPMSKKHFQPILDEVKSMQPIIKELKENQIELKNIILEMKNILGKPQSNNIQDIKKIEPEKTETV